MTRPHIEFIQCQVLAWQAGLVAGIREGVESKLLSRDAESGAVTVLIRYPPGWSQPDLHTVTAQEEFFVLDGMLTINGIDYRSRCYANLPENHLRRGAAAPDGAVVFAYFDKSPRTELGASTGPYDARRQIEFIEVPSMRDLGPADFARLGSSEFDPVGLGCKILREDPDTGEVTWIMGCDDGEWLESTTDGEARMERHPTVEEIFVLDGDMAGNLGTLRPGAYFWRPPDIWHGPYGVAKGGFLHLNRCHGGPFGTDFKTEAVAVDFDTPYQPILPPELEDLARVAPPPGVAW